MYKGYVFTKKFSLVIYFHQQCNAYNAKSAYLGTRWRCVFDIRKYLFMLVLFLFVVILCNVFCPISINVITQSYGFHINIYIYLTLHRLHMINDPQCIVYIVVSYDFYKIPLRPLNDLLLFFYILFLRFRTQKGNMGPYY